MRQIDYERGLKRDLKNEVTAEITAEVTAEVTSKAINDMYDFGIPIETICTRYTSKQVANALGIDESEISSYYQNILS